MALHILKCKNCNRYTIKDKCPDCGAEVLSTIPAKFSPEDPYGSYRREAKKETLKKKGLI